MKLIFNQIEKAFSHYELDDDGRAACTGIRSKARALAHFIDKSVPDSREKSLAMTKLEECVMWANAGIARNGVSYEEDSNALRARVRQS